MLGGAVVIAVWVAGLIVYGHAHDYRAVDDGFTATNDLPTGNEWLGAGPSALENSSCPGEGRRLCFVAVGEQPSEWVDELATYFADRYGLSTSVLPPVSLDGMERFEGELIDHERNQLDGGGVLEVLKALYPNIWVSGDVTLVAVTGYDMFDRRHPELAYWYSTRDFDPGRFTLVSNARMDDLAWGDAANDPLLRIRTRKLVAREIGTLYYGFTPSDDPYSVMAEVFGSRAGVDQASELLPVAAPEPTNRDVILTSRRWEGTGKWHTSIFEVEAGAFEFCASITNIENPVAGLRVGLYAEDGTWMISDTGRGAVGELGCTPIPAPGRYELQMTTYDKALEWSVTVQRVGLTPAPEAELPIWSTDGTTRQTPASTVGDSVVFEEFEDGWTPWFRPVDEDWELCWEIIPRPNPPEAGNLTYLDITVNLEQETLNVAKWKVDETAVGDGQCYSVHDSQPNGRLWVFVRIANHQAGYRLTLNGVTLVP